MILKFNAGKEERRGAAAMIPEIFTADTSVCCMLLSCVMLDAASLLFFFSLSLFFLLSFGPLLLTPFDLFFLFFFVFAAAAPVALSRGSSTGAARHLCFGDICRCGNREMD